eukprot:gene5348-3846_t
MLDVSVTRISSNCALSSVYHHMQPQDHLASPSLTDPAPSQRLSLRVVHDSISLRHCEAFRPVSFPRIPSSNTAIGSSSETKQERRKEKKHLWLTRKRDEKGGLANVREPVQLSVSVALPYEVVYVVIHLTARVDKAYATGSQTLSHDTGGKRGHRVQPGALPWKGNASEKMLDVSVTRISSNCALSSVYHHMQPQDHLASPSLTDPAPSQRLSLRVVHDSISLRHCEAFRPVSFPRIPSSNTAIGSSSETKQERRKEKKHLWLTRKRDEKGGLANVREPVQLSVSLRTSWSDQILPYEVVYVVIHLTARVDKAYATGSHTLSHDTGGKRGHRVQPGALPWKGNASEKMLDVSVTRISSNCALSSVYHHMQPQDHLASPSLTDPAPSQRLSLRVVHDSISLRHCEAFRPVSFPRIPSSNTAIGSSSETKQERRKEKKHLWLTRKRDEKGGLANVREPVQLSVSLRTSWSDQILPYEVVYVVIHLTARVDKAYATGSHTLSHDTGDGKGMHQKNARRVSHADQLKLCFVKCLSSYAAPGPPGLTQPHGPGSYLSQSSCTQKLNHFVHHKLRHCEAFRPVSFPRIPPFATIPDSTSYAGRGSCATIGNQARKKEGKEAFVVDKKETKRGLANVREPVQLSVSLRTSWSDQILPYEVVYVVIHLTARVDKAYATGSHTLSHDTGALPCLIVLLLQMERECIRKMLDVSVTRISSNCALSSVYHHMQPQDHLASPSLTDPAPSQRLSLRVVHDSISLRHCEAFRPVSFPRIPSSNTAIGSSHSPQYLTARRMRDGGSCATIGNQARKKEGKEAFVVDKKERRKRGGLANVREPVQLSVSLRTSWSDQITLRSHTFVIHLTARVDKAYATGSHTLARHWRKMLDVSVTRISSNCALSSVYHHMQPQDHLASPSLTDPAPSQRLSLRVVHDSISLRHCEAFRPVSFPRIPSSNTAIGSSSETKQERRKEKKHLWLTRKRDEKGVLANVREPVQLSVSLRTSWSDQILPYEVVYVVIHLTARVDKAYATGSHTLARHWRKMLDVSVTRISSNCALSSVYHHMQPQDHLASPSLTDPAPSQRLSLRVVHDSISLRHCEAFRPVSFPRIPSSNTAIGSSSETKQERRKEKKHLWLTRKRDEKGGLANVREPVQLSVSLRTSWSDQILPYEVVYVVIHLTARVDKAYATGSHTLSHDTGGKRGHRVQPGALPCLIVLLLQMERECIRKMLDVSVTRISSNCALSSVYHHMQPQDHLASPSLTDPAPQSSCTQKLNHFVHHKLRHCEAFRPVSFPRIPSSNTAIGSSSETKQERRKEKKHLWLTRKRDEKGGLANVREPVQLSVSLRTSWSDQILPYEVVYVVIHLTARVDKAYATGSHTLARHWRWKGNASEKMLDVSVTRISSNCALSSVYHHMQPQDHLASPSLTDPAPSQRLSLRVVHDSISLRHCEAFRPVSFPRIPSSNTAIGSSSETKQERRKEKKHLWLTRKRDEKGGLANVREPVQLSVSLRTSWSDQILPYEVVYVVIHLTARVDKAYATGSHTLARHWRKMLDVSVTRISSNCALSSVYHHMQPQDHLASPSLTDPAPSQRLSLRVVHDSISLRHCEAFRPVSFPRIPSSNTAIGSCAV